MKELLYDTLISLSSQDPEMHAGIRQHLYKQLDLPFDKQLILFAEILGPASSGKLESSQEITSAVNHALSIISSGK